MKAIVALASLIVAGCATNSGVQPFSGDVLTITKQAASGFASASDLRGATINDARTYCDGLGRRFAMVEVIEAQPPFILGNFPKAEVRFRCTE